MARPSPEVGIRFTPTSGSWLILVERFFADLTAVIRAGGFAGVAALRRTTTIRGPTDGPPRAKTKRDRTRLAEVQEPNH